MCAPRRGQARFWAHIGSKTSIGLPSHHLDVHCTKENIVIESGDIEMDEVDIVVSNITIKHDDPDLVLTEAMGAG